MTPPGCGRLHPMKSPSLCTIAGLRCTVRYKPEGLVVGNGWPMMSGRRREKEVIGSCSNDDWTDAFCVRLCPDINPSEMDFTPPERVLPSLHREVFGSSISEAGGLTLPASARPAGPPLASSAMFLTKNLQGKPVLSWKSL
jgi:hypothetical protein